jgi:DNA replication protein DnaC
MNSPRISEPTSLDSNVTKVLVTCERHGEYQASQFRLPFADKPITSSCPTCNAEFRAEDERRKREAARREKQERVAALFKRSGIPERFADRRLSNYAATTAGQKRALGIAERFVDSFGDGLTAGASLVLAGKPGTGKTHIACGIGRALIEQTRSVLFMTVLQALRYVKDTYRRESTRTESDAVADLLRPDLLILDEIGAQLGSEHEKMLMFEIINERYQRCRSTILISNLTGEELTAFLGDRVMDRFRESGAVLAFDWDSHRGQRGVA